MVRKRLSRSITQTKNLNRQRLTDWTTINEEHTTYHVFDSAHAIAHGVQKFKQKDGSEKTNDFVVAGLITTVLSKTAGLSTTMAIICNSEDPRYLDL